MKVLSVLGTRAEATKLAPLVYPVHLNPNVQTTGRRLLSGGPEVHLAAPLGDQPFVFLMERSALLITDTGGIQEEAPALGKPMLVMRDTTERSQAVHAATVRLVGTDLRIRNILQSRRKRSARRLA